MIDRRNSIYIGNLAATPIYLHWTFLFLLFFVYRWSAASSDGFEIVNFMTMAIVLLSGIVLHELGHGLTARAQGAYGVTITLWAFGGLCQSSRDSQRIGRELLIIAAGPLVSFLLALLAYVIFAALLRSNPALLAGGNPELLYVLNAYADQPARATYLAVAHGSMIGKLLGLAFQVNLLMGIFNMIPIYPLDGGQLLFNGMKLFLREVTAAKIAFGLGATLAFAYVGYDAHANGRIDLYLVAMFGFLLYNAYQYLR